MLVEPPRSDLPAGHRLSAESALRLALAAAAVLLAVLSRGDAVVLALVLAVAVWRPLPAAALVAALAASSWRWGSTSMEALAGDQAVLGPAGWVGPGAAAAGSWLAAVALVVAASDRLHGGAPRIRRGTPDLALARVTAAVRGAPPRQPRGRVAAPRLQAAASLVLALAAGSAAAAVVAGPAPGGELWVRVVAVVLGTAVAVAVTALRTSRPGAGRVLDGLALLAALGAVVAVLPDAGRLAGVVEADSVVEGVAVTLAAATVVLTTTTGALAMRHRSP